MTRRLAAIQQFGQAIELTHTVSIADIFDEVERGQVFVARGERVVRDRSLGHVVTQDLGPVEIDDRAVVGQDLGRDGVGHREAVGLGIQGPAVGAADLEVQVGSRGAALPGQGQHLAAAHGPGLRRQVQVHVVAPTRLLPGAHVAAQLVGQAAVEVAVAPQIDPRPA